MGLQTGMKLTPARMNVQRQSGQLAVAYTLTATLTDLTTPFFGFTLATAGSYLATWSGDFQLMTAGAPVAVIGLVVDGVMVAQPQAVWAPSNIAPGARETEGQTTSGTLTPGGHNFGLRAFLTGTGSVRLNAGHTQLTVVVYP